MRLFFASMSGGSNPYALPSASVDFGYTLYYMQTKYLGYNDNDCFALQHNIFFRFNINNFKFFKS